MYLGVDVGGTKTLVAVLNGDGVIKQSLKFPTPKKYDDFLKGISETLAGFKTQDFKAGGIGVPGTIDRKHGRGLRKLAILASISGADPNQFPAKCGHGSRAGSSRLEGKPRLRVKQIKKLPNAQVFLQGQAFFHGNVARIVLAK